jgi:hypothetical protein
MIYDVIVAGRGEEEGSGSGLHDCRDVMGTLCVRPAALFRSRGFCSEGFRQQRKQAPVGQTGPKMATRSSVKAEAPKSQTPTAATRKNPPRGQAVQVNQEDASGAGGLRGVDGSGQTGYVCGKLPPSSKPGS